MLYMRKSKPSKVTAVERREPSVNLILTPTLLLRWDNVQRQWCIAKHLGIESNSLVVEI